jgi:Uma2 family endonuclease
MPPQEKTQDLYTYTDYLSWPDDERWEIIDGQAYNMTPAPSFKHQQLVSNLHFQLRLALEGNPYVVGLSPTDVVLSAYNVVQPDVFIVCDRRKITEQNIQGPPEVVIEILSPATARKDRWEKKALYEKFGVREYLIIDPEGQYLERYLLSEQGVFPPGEAFGPDQTLTLQSINVIIPLSKIFEINAGEGSEEKNLDRKTGYRI